MKVIRCKLQLQSMQPINERQKDYYFACPIRNIKAGNTVLVQYSIRSEHRKKHTYLSVGRVEEIYEGKPWDMMAQYHPTATAVCLLEDKMQDYNAFWKRLNQSKNMAASLKRNYDDQNHKKAEIRKTKKMIKWEKQQEIKHLSKKANKKKHNDKPVIAKKADDILCD